MPITNNASDPTKVANFPTELISPPDFRHRYAAAYSTANWARENEADRQQYEAGGTGQGFAHEI